MLITSPFEEGETTLPSPNQLRFKIIIKNKKLPEAGGAAANEGAPADAAAAHQPKPGGKDTDKNDGK